MQQTVSIRGSTEWVRLNDRPPGGLAGEITSVWTQFAEPRRARIGDWWQCRRGYFFSEVEPRERNTSQIVEASRAPLRIF